MDITAKYQPDGFIEATINGEGPFVVPDDINNRHRIMIAEWEALGNSISPYIDNSFPLINRVQFKSMLALMGKSIDDVLAAIDAVIEDSTQNTIAKVKVTDSERYARDNELFTILAPTLNLTDEQINTAWGQALQI